MARTCCYNIRLLLLNLANNSQPEQLGKWQLTEWQNSFDQLFQLKKQSAAKQLHFAVCLLALG